MTPKALAELHWQNYMNVMGWKPAWPSTARGSCAQWFDACEQILMLRDPVIYGKVSLETVRFRERMK